MAEQQFHYFNQIPLRPHGRRWWPKAIAFSAFLGGIYGASMGSAVGAVPGTADVIAIAAAAMAFICGVPGARIGALLGIVTRIRFGRLYLGMFAAMGGAIIGGFLATMILLALGAILGAVGGWILMQAVLQRFFLRRIFGGIAGAVLGMFLGAMLWAVRLNQSAALAAAAWGLGIGIVVGPLLLLMVMGALNSLADTHVSGRKNVVDATFRRADQDRQGHDEKDALGLPKPQEEDQT